VWDAGLGRSGMHESKTRKENIGSYGTIMLKYAENKRELMCD
jgi:hypothetical protein